MTKKKPKDHFQTLTKREKEVLQLVCQHNSYQRIADKFGISRPTIKTHMHNIYVKLDLIHLEKRDERVMQIHNVYCPFFLKDEQSKKSEEPEEQTKKPASAEPELTEESRESEEESQEVQVIPVESESEQSSEDKEIEAGFQEEQIAPAEQVIDLELEPEPITPEEEEIIDGDEMALITYTPETISIGGKEEVGTKKKKKKRGCAKFILTLILGALMVVGAWYTWNHYVKDIPIVQSIVQLINPDAVIESSSDETSTAQSSETESSNAESSKSESIIESILPNTDKYADAYKMGDWAKQDDVWVRLFDYEVARDYIRLNFEIWNQTGQDIFFSWSPEQNFSMTDNKNNRYEVFTASTREVSVASDERLHFTGHGYSTVQFKDDPLFESGVTDLYVTMEYLSKIDEAVFHIGVGN